MRVATIDELLAAGAEEAPAIAAPGRGALTYGGLRRLIAGTLAALNAAGIGRNDRVAVVLPNGPEMAAAFVALSAGATVAPLNPAYKAEEFEFYLSDLKARALVCLAGEDSPAREVARRLGVRLAELRPHGSGPAGGFDLDLPEGAAAASGGLAGPDDVALVLHTSGTTSRPKIVPLTGANVTASARHIAATLALTPDDRCLNIMPLFHIHGLIGATLASLSAGASVFCTPGFNALKVFGWLDEARPTWLTAVPTMHQAILARAGRNAEILGRTRLRFIRSSSASLPPAVMRELEETFGCPVIESYGMTEASHQMTSNPLPPRARKPGSVGIAAGPEVAVMAPDGSLLAADEEGEVVIRGPNVTRGYEANPKANAEAFTHGWFRTGDQGVMDDEGYLRITGRLKELINRGGEKISPREVDDVLMEHPGIAQVVCFSVPHPMLGEEVGAAVVRVEGVAVGEDEIRRFALERLADFKVPRRIVFVEEIPKGATGKLQRIGLAARLGLAP
jgi:acyl-CoA synthetase (AMP-forming)/AMP-acid ligase II